MTENSTGDRGLNLKKDLHDIDRVLTVHEQIRAASLEELSNWENTIRAVEQELRERIESQHSARENYGKPSKFVDYGAPIAAGIIGALDYIFLGKAGGDTTLILTGVLTSGVSVRALVYKIKTILTNQLRGETRELVKMQQRARDLLKTIDEVRKKKPPKD